MNRRLSALNHYKAASGFALSLALVLTSEVAFAQRGIGSAVTVERDVSGTLSGRTRAIQAGEGVFLSENIRTANASAAQLRFLDQSSLSIGPSASIVLDRFVYNPDRTAREATVLVATGAARWVGGNSRPRAYQVRTPHAAIGVRGTMFDLLVEARRTIVTLREGEIFVCAIGASQRCLTLNVPGQVAIVTTTSIEGPTRAATSEFQFAANCLSPIDRSACVVTATQFVQQGWEGFTAGVHLGGVMSWASVAMGGSQSVLDSIGLGNVPSSFSAMGSGVIGGIQFGYQSQVENIVVGVEADVSALSANARESVVRSPIGVVVTTTSSYKIDYLATLRGRVGVADGNMLYYATAGLAVGFINWNGSLGGNCVGCTPFLGSSTHAQLGYVAGGGFERLIGASYAARMEFLYYDLRYENFVLRDVFNPGPYATMRVHPYGAIVRAAFNYRF